MRKSACILITGLILNPLAYAGSAQETEGKLKENDNERIKKCTELLPDGHSYTIDIKISVDKKALANDITKELNITDETLQEVGKDRKEKVKPFIQCMTDNVLQ